LFSNEQINVVPERGVPVMSTLRTALTTTSILPVQQRYRAAARLKFWRAIGISNERAAGNKLGTREFDAAKLCDHFDSRSRKAFGSVTGVLQVKFSQT
jgi:hypothetical protein